MPRISTLMLVLAIGFFTQEASAQDKTTDKTKAFVAQLAGTKWVNSNKATFEWDLSGKLFHNGKPRDYQAVDDRTIKIVFGNKHIDTFVFNAGLTAFEQFSTSVPKARPLFQGTKIADNAEKEKREALAKEAEKKKLADAELKRREAEEQKAAVAKKIVEEKAERERQKAAAREAAAKAEKERLAKKVEEKAERERKEAAIREAAEKAEKERQLAIWNKMPSLPGMDGKNHSLSEYKKDVVVVCFLRNSCPVSLAHTDRPIIDFTKKYGDKIDFVAIYVSTDNRDDDKLPKIKERGFTFPCLFDESKTTARSLGAKVTPHFFVFNKDRTLIYQGAMADNIFKPTVRYLEAATEAGLKGETPKVGPESQAKGCAIVGR